MPPQRLPSVLSGEDPYVEFCRLAKEFRARQTLAHSTPTRSSSAPLDFLSTQLAPQNSPRESTTAAAASPSTTAAAATTTTSSESSKPETVTEILTKQARPRAGTVDGTASLNRYMIRAGRPRPKKKKPRQGGAISGHFRNNKHRVAGGKDGAFGDNDNDNGGRINPYAEAAMLNVFNNKNKSGVSATAIRSLYRKRHEAAQANALNEVRRWWRLGRSETTSLAEATAAAALMLASKDKDVCGHEGPTGGNSNVCEKRTCGSDFAATDRFPGHLDSKGGDRWRNDVLPGGDHVGRRAPFTASNVTMLQPEWKDSLPAQTQIKDSKQSCCVYDDLDWRQVLQDHSYAAGLVRDIKQALKAGMRVKLCAREERSPGPNSWTDCQLMLKTLYMQCVRVRTYGSIMLQLRKILVKDC